MLFLPGRIAGSLLVLYGPGILVREPGVLFCHVECLETWEQSLEDALYWTARDEPCSCSISCGRINSVCRNILELLDCVWKHCSSCRMDYLWKHHCILYSKIDWRISPWIFSLLFFGNNSVHRIIVLVWMYAGNCCGFDHMESLMKQMKMYICTLKNIYSSRCSHIAVHGWTEYALEYAVVYIQSQQ